MCVLLVKSFMFLSYGETAKRYHTADWAVYIVVFNIMKAHWFNKQLQIVLTLDKTPLIKEFL